MQGVPTNIFNDALNTSIESLTECLNKYYSNRSTEFLEFMYALIDEIKAHFAHNFNLNEALIILGDKVERIASKYSDSPLDNYQQVFAQVYFLSIIANPQIETGVKYCIALGVEDAWNKMFLLKQVELDGDISTFLNHVADTKRKLELQIPKELLKKLELGIAAHTTGADLSKLDFQIQDLEPAQLTEITELPNTNSIKWLGKLTALKSLEDYLVIKKVLPKNSGFYKLFSGKETMLKVNKDMAITFLVFVRELYRQKAFKMEKGKSYLAFLHTHVGDLSYIPDKSLLTKYVTKQIAKGIVKPNAIKGFSTTIETILKK